ncbi:Transcription termination/antitermination protein NusA [Hyella patelloides LEGE 07179]|uniref:Transcription termination/antitermination protein NusA n=1 Tax=Hyella patelloides LEGE 07179 TaxID=945734 RepID=A0A563VPZ1_9CYAN|nr:transcription termination factor NusA [Hyella patelloides]VEP13493.1 Transcription termination/antitermination protein NusA [Hyella patelloides LEGE 07179]
MTIVSLPGLGSMIEQISQQYNLSTEDVEEALKEALIKGYERFRRTRETNRYKYNEEHFEDFMIHLDTEEEGFQVITTKTIVDLPKEEILDPDREIAFEDIRESAEDLQITVGDTVTVDVTPEQSDFGRMAAIQTKQVLLQKLRDRQRTLIQEEFKDLEGTVLQAKVLRFERQSAIVAVSSGVGQPEVEAELPKREQLPNDTYRSNTTFKVYLKKVRETPHRGPQLIVSRSAAGLVVELFSNEVPEIEEEIVRIVAVAREANPPSRYVGVRTKIAVDTTERDVDPVGACIGARGSRIREVVNELKGEKIDVIRWSPDPAAYIANSLSPARVDKVLLVDTTEEKQSLVLVAQDQLSLAIGKEGQNVRLAARLTGWKIDIKDIALYEEGAEEQLIKSKTTEEDTSDIVSTEIIAEEEETTETREPIENTEIKEPQTNLVADNSPAETEEKPVEEEAPM